MYYPKEVYNINEDVTKANKAAYDKKEAAKLENYLLKCPGYLNLSIKDRYAIRKAGEESKQ
jgi:hypothetical protein